MGPMLSLLPLFALLLAAAPAPAQPEPARTPLALTISGGVSLGAYEAGLTWSLVQVLREARRSGAGVDLAAVTGASAGSLNALLAAALWCEDPGELRDTSVSHNLFHESWAPVGLDELLPEDASTWREGDGLLASAPLEKQLQNLKAWLFGNGARKLRPNCAVPLGLSVTRTDPEERDVSGLRSRAQRFVVPLVFEVTWDGKPRLFRAQLPADRASANSSLFLGEQAEEGTGLPVVGPQQLFNALLSSGAFPMAFRPRELCDCSLSCPADRRVEGATCPGPDQRPLTGLSCAAVLPAGKRTLCRQSYVDGGIFDNAPVGLAIDLAEWIKASTPLQPISYLMFDPDFRRYPPTDPQMGERAAELGFKGPLQLFSNLVQTARSTELSSAIRADGWNRTTRRTLAAAARMNAAFAELREEVVLVAGGALVAPDRFRMALAQHPERERIGRLLLGCFAGLESAAAAGAGQQALLARCAEELRQPKPQPGPAPARLAPAETLQLARGLASLIASGNEGPARPIDALVDPKAKLAARLEALAAFRDGGVVVGVGFRFLDGEVDGLARSGLPDATLRAFRRDLLETARQSARLARASDAMLRVVTATVLAEEQPERGAATAALLLSGDAGEPADGPSLRALADALQPRSKRLDGLIAFGPRLRQLTTRAEEVARLADQLTESAGTERQLTVSRRFSPLAGSLLGAFAGFLDRSLRELDYLIGVYDTTIAYASYQCQNQGVYETARTAPVFRDDDPLELDVREPDTWRCLGEALKAGVDQLGLLESERARRVIAHLARLEVAAALDDRPAAASLLREAAWSWLDAFDAQLPGDPVAIALEVVTAKRLPCTPVSPDALCLGDPGFDELIDGLQRGGYTPGSRAMQQVLGDRAGWTASLVRKLADRSASIEMENAGRGHRSPSDGLLLGVGAGELWSRRALLLREWPRLVVDPSSIPAHPLPGTGAGGLLLAHLLPYRISLDVAKGGLALSWFEPRLQFLPWLSLQTQVDLLELDSDARLSTTLGALPTVTAFGLSLSAGPRWSWRAGEDVHTPGWMVRLAVAQERLSIGVGWRSLAAAERTWFVTLGVSDLNGLAYWLTPFGQPAE